MPNSYSNLSRRLYRYFQTRPSTDTLACRPTLPWSEELNSTVPPRGPCPDIVHIWASKGFLYQSFGISVDAVAAMVPGSSGTPLDVKADKSCSENWSPGSSKNMDGQRGLSSHPGVGPPIRQMRNMFPRKLLRLLHEKPYVPGALNFTSFLHSTPNTLEPKSSKPTNRHSSGKHRYQTLAYVGIPVVSDVQSRS